MMRLIARRLYLPGGDHDDLAQEARMGLVDAVRTWDPERGVPFSNFAWLCATREARNAVNAARANKHHCSYHGPRPARRRRGRAMDALDRRRAPFDPTRRPAASGSACPPSSASVAATTTRWPRRSAREQLRALIARTRTLSPLERRALALATNDHSHREIAATLHIRVRAVNNALQRARRKLGDPVAA